MSVDRVNQLRQLFANSRYMLQDVLGRGGMAEVFRAWDMQRARDVVVKIPREHVLVNPVFAERFAREIETHSQLVHPNIIRIRDSGFIKDVPFLVLPYMDGGSLKTRREKIDERLYAPMPFESLAEWLGKVAVALDFIHQNHFVHRDIKPENILFDTKKRVYVSDLGIVKALDPVTESSEQTLLTAQNMAIGTPQYMAPEMILGRPYDGRVDQYALAITVYECLAGRVPFQDPTPSAIIVKHTTEPPPDIRQYAPAIKPQVKAAIERALAKDPDDRFETCADFARQVLLGRKRRSGSNPNMKVSPTPERETSNPQTETPVPSEKLANIPCKVGSRSEHTEQIHDGGEEQTDPAPGGLPAWVFMVITLIFLALAVTALVFLLRNVLR